MQFREWSLQRSEYRPHLNLHLPICDLPALPCTNTELKRLNNILLILEMQKLRLKKEKGSAQVAESRPSTQVI